MSASGIALDDHLQQADIFPHNLPPVERIMAIPMLVVLAIKRDKYTSTLAHDRMQWPPCLLSHSVKQRSTACIDHYALTVSEWTKDNTVLFGLRDMIRRFRDCLGH